VRLWQAGIRPNYIPLPEVSPIQTEVGTAAKKRERFNFS